MVDLSPRTYDQAVRRLPAVVRSLAATLGRSSLVPDVRRTALVRVAAPGVDAGAWIAAGVRFGNGVQVAAQAYLGEQCLIQGPCTIGRATQLGPRVCIVTHTHAIGGSSRRAVEPPQVKPVDIGRGCWIGAGAMILPGVTIGDGVVVAAGAVVTDDCAPDGLYAGVPSRRVREL